GGKEARREAEKACLTSCCCCSVRLCLWPPNGMSPSGWDGWKGRTCVPRGGGGREVLCRPSMPPCACFRQGFVFCLLVFRGTVWASIAPDVLLEVRFPASERLGM
ncbi:unnamed protein product, partial [Ectocarpus sp. 12 AP-2014]